VEDDGRRFPSGSPRPQSVRLVSPEEPKLDPKLQALIGEQLRGYYAELLSEPVPERFAELVKRLDRKH
jgi:hypothetical protein